jgi:hypothetical protein
VRSGRWAFELNPSGRRRLTKQKSFSRNKPRPSSTAAWTSLFSRRSPNYPLSNRRSKRSKRSQICRSSHK